MSSAIVPKVYMVYKCKALKFTNNNKFEKYRCRSMTVLKMAIFTENNFAWNDNTYNS